MATYYFYEKVDVDLTYSQAEAACADRGMQLPSIANQEEYDALLSARWSVTAVLLCFLLFSQVRQVKGESCLDKIAN